MLNVIYADCHLCWVSHKSSLCWVSLFWVSWRLILRSKWLVFTNALALFIAGLLTAVKSFKVQAFEESSNIAKSSFAFVTNSKRGGRGVILKNFLRASYVHFWLGVPYHEGDLEFSRSSFVFKAPPILKTIVRRFEIAFHSKTFFANGANFQLKWVGKCQDCC